MVVRKLCVLLTWPLLSCLPPEVAGVQPAAPAGEAAPAARGVLKAGDAAPSLAGAVWIQGDAFEKFEPGTIYVVDFWATWCRPCIQTIPHLSQLAQKFKDKKVRVLGVSIWENQQRRPVPAGAMETKVREFVKKQTNMKYAVAYAGDSGTIEENWMAAARRNSIPTAFVIGRDGKIVWYGHPSQGLETALDGLLAGTFDPAAEADRARELEEKMSRQQGLATLMQKAFTNGDYGKALQHCDEILALDNQLFAYAAVRRFSLLLIDIHDEQGAYDWAKRVLEQDYPDRAPVHAGFAEVVLRSSPNAEHLAWASEIAKRAEELTEGRDAGVLTVQARVRHAQGQRDEAIATLRRALAIAGNEIKPVIQTYLAEYEAQALQPAK